MFEPLEIIPLEELEQRWSRCRSVLAEVAPDAGGLLVFSRLHIYYFTGTLGQGVFWLPREGQPVFMVRKSMARAELESMVERLSPFRSYKDIPRILNDWGDTLPDTVAAETAGLSWQLGQMLESRLPDTRIVPGDMAIMRTRAVKSDRELQVMRRCGLLHHKALHGILPERIKPGMTEREISHIIWDVFFSLGHTGIMRMNAFGEEIFLGNVSAGDSGNYPSTFNGPLGLRGEHPAVPYMGHSGRNWKAEDPLATDVGFALNGYQTDKTQVYWAGSRSDIPKDIMEAQTFCEEMEAWTAANLKPGAIPSELYAHCVRQAAEAGFAEGFMGLGENKVPFIGHGIGLTVDGWPVIAERFDLPLEAGMTLAVEPKIGIPGAGMVGVEDTFEVTESGGVSITGKEQELGIICLGDLSG